MTRDSKVGWCNQNEFIMQQQRTKQETILVASRMLHNHLDHDLLSWSINVAAHPHDTVIALLVATPRVGKFRKFLRSLDNGEAWFKNSQLAPLQEICNIKQVQLDIIFTFSKSLESALTDYAHSSRASMVIIQSSGRRSQRQAQKRGSSLALHAPKGCSVVVVKDFKVLYYRERLSNEDSSPFTKETGGEVYYIGLNKMGYSKGSKGWGDEVGELSPRGVLEIRGRSSEPNESTKKGGYSRLLFHSSSHKRLLSLSSSSSLSLSPSSSCRFRHDDVSDGNGSSSPRHLPSCLPLWRGMPTSPFKRLTASVSSHYSRHSKRYDYLGPATATSIVTEKPTSIAMATPASIAAAVTCGGLDRSRSLCPIPIEKDVNHRSWMCFTFQEISNATNAFNAGNLVGKGGHAEVYKGLLPNGQIIAVKCLRADEEEKENGFLTELGILGHVSHPNTTPVIGFCIEKGLHLIFSLSRHGSLSSLLHMGSEGGGGILNWGVRYKVAVGTARGLHYLHTSCQRRIIHRDIKASNILLTENFEPQISDFGLAKWLPEQWTHLIALPVEGTFGYLAPEYVMHGIVDEKTDVYAFGVLLLELITGQEPINSQQQSLVKWARPLMESGNLRDLVDPHLPGGTYALQEMQFMIMAAAACIQHSPACRPSMGQVLNLLSDSEGLCLELQNLASFQSTYSDEDYSRASYLNDLDRHREIALQF